LADPRLAEGEGKKGQGGRKENFSAPFYPPRKGGEAPFPLSFLPTKKSKRPGKRKELSLPLPAAEKKGKNGPEKQPWQKKGEGTGRILGRIPLRLSAEEDMGGERKKSRRFFVTRAFSEKSGGRKGEERGKKSMEYFHLRKKGKVKGGGGRAFTSLL